MSKVGPGQDLVIDRQAVGTGALECPKHPLSAIHGRPDPPPRSSNGIPSGAGDGSSRNPLRASSVGGGCVGGGSVGRMRAWLVSTVSLKHLVDGSHRTLPRNGASPHRCSPHPSQAATAAGGPSERFPSCVTQWRDAVRKRLLEGTAPGPASQPEA